MKVMSKKYLDYEGLQRLVENIDKKYAPIAALIFKSTVENIEALPALASVKAGWMYNVTVGGGTTSDFIEGPGHILGDGENVAAVELITGYTAVSPSLITPDKDPKALGWYEVANIAYNDVTATLPDGANPAALGLYEYVAADDKYVLTIDTTVASGKEYYEQVITYEISEDRIADSTKTYYTASTVKKWDILGGVFDLEGRYLEFGQEFPVSPVDGRTFLYMGEDTFTYNAVTDPEGRPVDNGWYELVDVYTAITPVGDEDPSELGWYEKTGSDPDVYTLSVDTTVDPLKTYYKKTEKYQLTADITVDPAKTYYTKDAEYKQGVIYEYDATEAEWVAKSGAAGDDFVAITASEIDDLFL